MHTEMREFVRLAAIILSVIALASLGLVVEPLNGLAWMIGSPIVVGGYLGFRYYRKRRRSDAA